MAEVLPRHYLFGVIVFTFFIVAGVSMIGIFKSNNPAFATGDDYTRFNETFNQLDDVSTTINKLEGGITEAETDFGAFGVLNSLISSGWNTLKLMFSSFDIMNDAYNGLSDIFNIPAWIPGLLILAVTVMLAFTIFSAIFQKEL
jgi:hypothetical protein